MDIQGKKSGIFGKRQKLDNTHEVKVGNKSTATQVHDVTKSGNL